MAIVSLPLNVSFASIWGWYNNATKDFRYVNIVQSRGLLKRDKSMGNGNKKSPKSLCSEAKSFYSNWTIYGIDDTK